MVRFFFLGTVLCIFYDEACPLESPERSISGLICADLINFLLTRHKQIKGHHAELIDFWFERQEFFDKKKNPFFEHAEVDYFIARRNGQAVGVIAAILNHRHNEFQEENVSHFGIFEVLNDPEAAAALLETAEDWGRQKGTDRILGPANFSTNDEVGLLIEGFDSPPVVLMPYNPTYYIDFIESSGYTKAMDLLAWNTDAESNGLEYVLCIYSDDGGENWSSPPDTLSSADGIIGGTSTTSGRPVLARGTNGKMVCTWHEELDLFPNRETFVNQFDGSQYSF